MVNIIIVGAGMSALSAARHLLKKKPATSSMNIIILEARNRIGGRVWTENISFSHPIDLGAQFIHYHASNPLYDIAKEHNVQMKMASEKNFPKIFDADEKVSHEYVLNQWEKLEDFMSEHVEDAFSKLETDQDFPSAFNRVLEMKGIQLSAHDKRIWESYIHDWCAAYNAADAIELGSRHFFHNSEHEGTSDDMIVPQGMGQLIDILAKGLDIRLNHEVSHIEYGSRDVTVKTTDGREFKCDKVLVTVPLGVLKKRTIQFSPPLPRNKIEAIATIGFGSMSKVFLEFENADAWDNNTQSFAILPSADGEIKGYYILNWKNLTGRNVLIVFASGSLSRQMGQDPAEVTLAKVLKALRVMNKNLPDPIRYKVANWDKDKYAYGAYSYVSVGTSPQSFLDYEATIDNKVYFAGEASSSFLYGYVQGAYYTGIREADKILTSANNNNNKIHSRL